MADAAENRREHEHAEESADEKRILEIARQHPALREAADPGIEAGHARHQLPIARRRQQFANAGVAEHVHTAFGDDAPIQHADAIGDAPHLVHVVRHHQHGRSSLRA